MLFYFSACSSQKSILDESYYIDIDKDQRSIKKCNKAEHEVKNSYNTEDKIDIDNRNASKWTKPRSRNSPEMNVDTYSSSKTIQNGLAMLINECSINSIQKKRASGCITRDVLSNPKHQKKPYLKNVLFQSHSASPVNLKKIRAVLSRGDPFPIHLTKQCINNITPDLQREKL